MMDRAKLGRTLVACLAVAMLLLPMRAQAAGTLSVSTQQIGMKAWKHTIAWTSTAGGAVSANALGIASGNIVQAMFVPGAGGTQPSDLYDAQLNTPMGTINILGTSGDNLSNATSLLIEFVPPYFHDATSQLDLVIAAAGSAKTGTVIIWVVSP